MKWWDSIMEMDFDDWLGNFQLNGSKPTKILVFALDIFYERFRFLAGARWNHRLKKHHYPGLTMERVVYYVLKGEW